MGVEMFEVPDDLIHSGSGKCVTEGKNKDPGRKSVPLFPLPGSFCLVCIRNSLHGGPRAGQDQNPWPPPLPPLLPPPPPLLPPPPLEDLTGS